MTDASPTRRAPPISPHVQLDAPVWRWHITMFTSIAHRATGVALYVGALIVAGWALALASGPDLYARYMELLASPIGRIMLFGLTVSLFYHLANGIRHLVWDVGAGFELKTANATSWVVIAAAIVATLALWGFAFSQGLVR